jgi:SMI1 / KNR4 family (SUKH-1)
MESTDNNVWNPNPYGVLDAKKLAKFESAISRKLPSEYAAYLLQYNGGEFANRNYLYNEVIQASIHHMYGLHEGPHYLRLAERYSLDEYYDLQEFSADIKGFLVFASTPTGELFLLDFKTGAVQFFDKAAFDGSRESLKRAVVFFENGFNEFVQKLVSDQELGRRLRELGVIDEEFDRRLAMAKANRAKRTQGN